MNDAAPTMAKPLAVLGHRRRIDAAPDPSLCGVGRGTPGMSFFQPPQLERFLDGLRKAGLPE